jgi:hypothetical protein
MESNDKLEELLHQMYAQESLHDDDINTSDIIDEEWTKFEAEHFRSERSDVRGKRIPFLKIAAMIMGVLMLSGIAYATIYIISSNSQKAQEEQTMATANSQLSTLNSQLAEQDSTQHKPIVYENAKLEVILDDIATFHQVEPVYKKEETKHIRLYFTWDKKQDLDNIIDTFNKFERIHITRYDKILIVE